MFNQGVNHWLDVITISAITVSQGGKTQKTFGADHRFSCIFILYHRSPIILLSESLKLKQNQNSGLNPSRHNLRKQPHIWTLIVKLLRKQRSLPLMLSMKGTSLLSYFRFTEDLTDKFNFNISDHVSNLKIEIN